MTTIAWGDGLAHLHAEEGDAGEEVDGGLEVLQLLRRRGWEVVAVHAQVDPQRVVQLVQKLDELLFLEGHHR